jgi:hypothetical protein
MALSAAGDPLRRWPMPFVSSVKIAYDSPFPNASSYNERMNVLSCTKVTPEASFFMRTVFEAGISQLSRDAQAARARKGRRR